MSGQRYEFLQNATSGDQIHDQVDENLTVLATNTDKVFASFALSESENKKKYFTTKENKSQISSKKLRPVNSKPNDWILLVSVS